MSFCDDDWFGYDCDLPRCGQRGIVDYRTRKCVCKGNFLPPFCRNCRPEFWGENCELKRFSPVNEPDEYAALTPIVLLFAFLSLTMLLLAYAAYTRRQREMTVIDTSASPPKYDQLVHDRPPTYDEATGDDGKIYQQQQQQQQLVQ